MFARGDRGYGLTEFLVVTLIVALAFGLLLAWCSSMAQADAVGGAAASLVDEGDAQAPAAIAGPQAAIGSP